MYVYVIGRGQDLYEPYSNCYVGVASNLRNRWNSHNKSDYRVGRTIRKYSLSYAKNMIVIFEGSREECFELERKLRPVSNIGLNLAEGGCGGFTVEWSEERKKRLSSKLKGRKITWKDKISETRTKTNVAKGNRNPRALSWKITDPNQQVYVVTGELKSFCSEHEINFMALRNFKGSVVPTTSVYYRGKNNPELLRIRNNTVGWRLDNLHS